MYQAIIESHNLNRIETEPQIIAKPKRETLSELCEFVDVFVRMEHIKLLTGYAISVHYTKVRE